jgi:hypothetical protein
MKNIIRKNNGVQIYYSTARAPGVTRDETPHNTLPAQSLPEIQLLDDGAESKAIKPNLSQNPRSKDRQIWALGAWPKRAPDPGGGHDREPRPKESHHASEREVLLSYLRGRGARNPSFVGRLVRTRRRRERGTGRAIGGDGDRGGGEGFIRGKSRGSRSCELDRAHCPTSRKKNTINVRQIKGSG